MVFRAIKNLVMFIYNKLVTLNKCIGKIIDFPDITDETFI